jgi:hypothetical protein
MNLQLKPRIDSVLLHPHSTCAFRDTHSLLPRLRTRPSDPTKPIGDHQRPEQKLSKRHKTRIPSGCHHPKPMQRP